MTIRLYDEQPYEQSFAGTVLSCVKDPEKEDLFKVVLDRTLFFPEEGGQMCDLGTLSGVPVTDVQIAGGTITHTLSAKALPFEEGTVIEGSIDMHRRFDQMQQHTAEHILSGLVFRNYGYNNVGFHLNDSVTTMDYDHVLTGEEITALEDEANAAVFRNIEVSVSFPGDEEAKTLAYRSKKEITDDALRIVTIPGIDVCACCAPHVRRTGEIGLIKIINAINWKGGIRLTMLSGERALSLFRTEHDLVTSVANDLSTSVENIPDRFDKMREEIASLHVALNNARAELLRTRIKSLPAEDPHVILLADADTGEIVIRNTINELTENRTGFCGILTGGEDGAYRYIIGSKALDCRMLQQKLTEACGAKGGGKPEMIQGRFTLPEGTDPAAEILKLI